MAGYGDETHFCILRYKGRDDYRNEPEGITLQDLRDVFLPYEWETALESLLEFGEYDTAEGDEHYTTDDRDAVRRHVEVLRTRDNQHDS